MWAEWSNKGGMSGPKTLARTFAGDDTPRSSLIDYNGTRFDGLMLDIDRAVRQLPELLQRPIRFFYLKDMGRYGAAQACRIAVRTFDGRLSLAYYHIDAALQGKR